MESLESRVQSFLNIKSSSSKTLSWPHPDSFIATPNSLAEAGFYFKPSRDDPDNVICFLCGKELGGWDDVDNPFEIHTRKCPKCPWVLVRCALEDDFDSSGNFFVNHPTRLPTNKALEKARLDTYGGKAKWWSHDTNKKHGATSKKMAKAGFVYTPQIAGDDTATCFYCDIALSGWDEDDDPLTEHRKRETRSGKPCPFFQAQLSSSSTSQTSRTKSSSSTKLTKPLRSMKTDSTSPIEQVDESDDELGIITASTSTVGPARKGKSKRTAPPTRTPANVDTKPSPETTSISQSKPASIVSSTAIKTRKSSRKQTSEHGSNTVDGMKTTRTSRSASHVSDGEIGKAKHRGKQRIDTLVEEAGDDVSRDAKKYEADEPAAGAARPRNLGRSNESPSNVNGKVTRIYDEFTVGLDAMDKIRGNYIGKGQTRSHSRSRSTSQPKSRTLESESEQKEPSTPPQSANGHTRSKSNTTTMAEQALVQPVKTRKAKPHTRSKSVLSYNSSESESQTISRKDVFSNEGLLPSVASQNKSAPAGRKARKPKTKTSSVDAISSSVPTSVQQPQVRGKYKAKELTFDIDIGERRPTAITSEWVSSKPDVSQSGRFEIMPQGGNQEVVANEVAATIAGQDDTSELHLSKGQFKGKDDARDACTSPIFVSQEQVVLCEAQDVVSNDQVRESDSLSLATDAMRNARMDIDGTDVRPISPRTPQRQVGKSTSLAEVWHISDEASPTPIIQTSELVEDAQDQSHVPFVPSLAMTPMKHISTLTDAERAMTVEQWIRHEMSLQYEQLKRDGEKRIEAFKQRAREVREQIEAL